MLHIGSLKTKKENFRAAPHGRGLGKRLSREKDERIDVRTCKREVFDEGRGWGGGDNGGTKGERVGVVGKVARERERGEVERKVREGKNEAGGWV